MVDAAAPKDVLQGDGVVVDVKATEQTLNIADKLGVLGAAPELRLCLTELIRVFAMADGLPHRLEISAIAGVFIAVYIEVIGSPQRVTEVVVCTALGLLLQPIDEICHRALHEHIQSVGGTAAVTLYIGDTAWVRVVAGLVVLAQFTDTHAGPRLTGSQQYGGQTAHRHHRRQDQCHSPFRPLHVDTPCLISKLYGKRRRRESPPPIYITIVMCSIPSVCVVVYQKNEKNTKNMKILSPAPQDLGGFMARNGV